MSNNVVWRVDWPLSLRFICENAVLTTYVSLQKTTSRIQEEFVVVYFVCNFNAGSIWVERGGGLLNIKQPFGLVDGGLFWGISNSWSRCWFDILIHFYRECMLNLCTLAYMHGDEVLWICARFCRVKRRLQVTGVPLTIFTKQLWTPL